MSFIRTRSNKERVALREPSGRPNGKQYLKNTSLAKVTRETEIVLPEIGNLRFEQHPQPLLDVLKLLLLLVGHTAHSVGSKVITVVINKSENSSTRLKNTNLLP